MLQFFVSLNARGNSVFQKKKTAPTCVGNSSFYKKNESAYDGYLGDTFLQVITIFELFMS